jgi:hypothetical protein
MGIAHQKDEAGLRLVQLRIDERQALVGIRLGGQLARLHGADPECSAGANQQSDLDSQPKGKTSFGLHA